MTSQILFSIFYAGIEEKNISLFFLGNLKFIALVSREQLGRFC